MLIPSTALVAARLSSSSIVRGQGFAQVGVNAPVREVVYRAGVGVGA